jgi:hypothetical protein
MLTFSLEKNKRYYSQFQLDLEASNLLTEIKNGARKIKAV